MGAGVVIGNDGLLHFASPQLPQAVKPQWLPSKGGSRTARGVRRLTDDAPLQDNALRASPLHHCTLFRQPRVAYTSRPVRCVRVPEGTIRCRAYAHGYSG
jgi:hypothetical protein